MESGSRQVIHLQSGGGLVTPTDTLWGLSTLPTKEGAELILELKGYEHPRPLVLLGSRLQCLEDWVSPEDLDALSQLKPSYPTSYLCHPGPLALSLSPFALGEEGLVCARVLAPERCPALAALFEALISGGQGGLLWSSSANPQGAPYAQTLSEARRYFGEDPRLLYLEDAFVSARPSFIVRLSDGEKLR